MQNRLQEVSLPWVLRIKKLQQLENKLLINHFFPYRGLEVWGLEEPEEELIHKSEVRPRCLEGWVVLLRVKVRVVTGRQRSEQVARDHSYDLGIDSFRQDSPASGYVVNNLESIASLKDSDPTSFRVALLISFPLRSATGSMKSKPTQHWRSFRMNSSSCSELGTSGEEKLKSHFHPHPFVLDTKSWKFIGQPNRPDH